MLTKDKPLVRFRAGPDGVMCKVAVPDKGSIVVITTFGETTDQAFDAARRCWTFRSAA